MKGLDGLMLKIIIKETRLRFQYSTTRPGTVLALLKKGRQSASGEGRKPPGICPGATTIVALKLVGSRTTKGQMEAIS
jgi:hypothetical protein